MLTYCKLYFANNIILSCFFLIFLIAGLYFLITAVITQISNPSAEILKDKAIDIKTHPVIAESQISDSSM